jgi:PmbA protein
VGRHIFANSRGFAGEYRASYCSLSTSPVARDGDSMERDYWYTIARGFAGLESPEEVGRTAAQRALRRLNAVKVDTQKVPVVFEPRTARTLLDNIFEAVHGMSIYRHESFLAGKLGEKVASENVTVIDDGTLPGLFGTSPFDDEGVPSRRTVVIERGVLKSYLLNTYAARKLGMKTTGNASRGLTGNAGIGHGNFFPGKGRPNAGADYCGDPNGFYVTELMGFGVNIVTGRLLARRGRAVDPQRRTGVRGERSDHRRESEGHAAGHGSGRLATWSSAARWRRPQSRLEK